MVIKMITIHTTHLCHLFCGPMIRSRRASIAAFPVAKDMTLAARWKKLISRAYDLLSIVRNCIDLYPPTLFEPYSNPRMQGIMPISRRARVNSGFTKRHYTSSLNISGGTYQRDEHQQIVPARLLNESSRLKLIATIKTATALSVHMTTITAGLLLESWIFNAGIIRLSDFVRLLQLACNFGLWYHTLYCALLPRYCTRLYTTLMRR